MRNPFLITLLALIVMLILSMAVGSVFIPPTELWHVLTGVGSNPTFRTILLNIRLPRTALIALVGAALAVSGGTYQGLFRNALADPYLIGVASGAGLGAISAVAFEWDRSVLGSYVIPLASFAGALLTVLLVYGLSRVGRSTPSTTLILAGVAIGTLATSLATFIML